MTGPEDEQRRARSFGEVAERYERYRPGYDEGVVDLVLEPLAAQAAPVRGVEIGAGTGKATRAVAGRGVHVDAVEPDPAMRAVLERTCAGLPVRIVPGTLEDVDGLGPVDLVYAAAALHWTEASTRWSRIATLLRPGGVFANLGGPVDVADEDLAARVQELRDRRVPHERVPGVEDDPDSPLRWPGEELLASALFTDVEQLERVETWTAAADDVVGHLATVSAVIVLADGIRAELLNEVRALLPDPVALRRTVTVHRARRTDVPARPQGMMRA